MRAYDDVYIIQDTGTDDSHGSANTFFGRLIDEFESTFKLVFVFHQPASDSKAQGGMTIVAASVHETRMSGAESQTIRSVIRIVGFFDRIAVHVKTEGGDRAGTTGV